MLARGADLAAVAAQLGHSNVATTGGTYSHVTAGSVTRSLHLDQTPLNFAQIAADLPVPNVAHAYIYFDCMGRDNSRPIFTYFVVAIRSRLIAKYSADNSMPT